MNKYSSNCLKHHHTENKVEKRLSTALYHLKRHKSYEQCHPALGTNTYVMQQQLRLRLLHLTAVARSGVPS
jgi:hypothetical protein